MKTKVSKIKIAGISIQQGYAVGVEHPSGSHFSPMKTVFGTFAEADERAKRIASHHGLFEYVSMR